MTDEDHAEETAEDPAAGVSPDESTEFLSDPTPSMPLAQQNSNLRGEFDRMLLLAEELQARCDHLDNRVRFVGWVGSTMVLATFAGGLYFTSRGEWVIGVVFGAPAFISATILLALLQARPRRHLARDRRALAEIVELLRETQVGLGYQGVLTPFETAQIRIRLSRFDIGPT